MSKSSKERVYDGSFPWHAGAENILREQYLDKIKNVLENIGNVVIKHWHFYGSRAPDVRAFDDYDDFTEYLEVEVIPGDIIDVWSMDDLLNENNVLVYGKYPDKKGLIPENGAY